MATIYTVSQLNNEIKDLLDAVPGYRGLMVQGEISNYKAHSSGHHYMTLKDENAAINAVMFRSDAMRLKFRLQNGMKVIVKARVSSFPRTGAVQLYVSEIIPDGAARGMEMQNLTVGVIGTGRIGKAVIHNLSGFGCRIIAHDPYPSEEMKQMGVEYVSLESLYAQSDVITLHTFLNDSTYHMINTEAIQQMKPGVVIINCARGALIDTRALIDGIESGRVGSVGVDCFEGEDNVIRVDHNYNSRVTNHDYIILKSFQNTIVTPHVAFFTDQAVFDMVQCSLESLHQFELGEKVPLEVHAA